MPDDQMPLTGELAMGESVSAIAEEPSKDAPPQNGGETPAASNNEVPDAPADEAVTPKDTKPFVSGSTQARRLGESRKKLAATLISSARENPDVRNRLKELVKSEPDLDKYLQKGWSKDYKEIILEEEVSLEPQETTESLRAKLSAEMLVEQLKEEKRNSSDDLAEKLGFTKDEAELLHSQSLALEGKKLGNKELTYEDALLRVARSISPDKAQVGLSFPSGTPAADISVNLAKESQQDALATKAKSLRGGNKKDIMENLKIVEKNTKGDVFTFPME